MSVCVGGTSALSDGSPPGQLRRWLWAAGGLGTPTPCAARLAAAMPVQPWGVQPKLK